jgi:hypothetical protein
MHLLAKFISQGFALDREASPLSLASRETLAPLKNRDYTHRRTSQQKEILWVFNLVRQEQANGFEGLFSAVDIVSEKKIVGVWWESTVLKESEEVVVLSVDVAAYLDGGL